MVTAVPVEDYKMVRKLGKISLTFSNKENNSYHLWFEIEDKTSYLALLKPYMIIQSQLLSLKENQQ